MRFIDIDKVKKELDKNKPDWTAEDYAVACEDAEFYSTIEDFMAEHEEDIEMMMFAPELVPDEPSWIPCSERLPEVYERVLTADKDGNVIENFRCNIKTGALEWSKGFWITHWMPMPEPPESEVQHEA